MRVLAKADLIGGGPEILLLGIIPLLAIFGANYVINFGIAWVFRNHLRVKNQPTYSTLAFVTIAGLLIDMAAFALSAFFTEQAFLRTAFIGLFVLAGMATATYWLIYRKELEQKEAVIASIAFGVISNPFWILVAFGSGLKLL